MCSKRELSCVYTDPRTRTGLLAFLPLHAVVVHYLHLDCCFADHQGQAWWLKKSAYNNNRNNSKRLGTWIILFVGDEISIFFGVSFCFVNQDALNKPTPGRTCKDQSYLMWIPQQHDVMFVWGICMYLSEWCSSFRTSKTSHHTEITLQQNNSSRIYRYRWSR